MNSTKRTSPRTRHPKPAAPEPAVAGPDDRDFLVAALRHDNGRLAARVAELEAAIRVEQAATQIKAAWLQQQLDAAAATG